MLFQDGSARSQPSLCPYNILQSSTSHSKHKGFSHISPQGKHAPRGSLLRARCVWVLLSYSGFLFLKILFLSAFLAGRVNKITIGTLQCGMYFQKSFHIQLPSENTLSIHSSQTMFSPISVSAKTDPSGFSPAEYIPYCFHTACQETLNDAFYRTHFHSCSFSLVIIKRHEQAPRTADLERDRCTQCCQTDETEVSPRPSLPRVQADPQ